MSEDAAAYVLRSMDRIGITRMSSNFGIEMAEFSVFLCESLRSLMTDDMYPHQLFYEL